MGRCRVAGGVSKGLAGVKVVEAVCFSAGKTDSGAKDGGR